MTISTYLWPGKTIFGDGTAELVGQEAAKYGAKTAFVVADEGIIAAGLLTNILNALTKSAIHPIIFDGVEANPSMHTVNRAAAVFREQGCDMIVGVGGGSSLDTAKAVKLHAGGPAEASIWEYAFLYGKEKRPLPPAKQMPPYIAIPTTAGTGSEVTPWALITQSEQQIKFGVGDTATIPDIALLDPELTITLPPHLTAATGMDALSHLIEAYVSTNHNPILDPMILHGIKLIGRSLRVAVARGDNKQARSDMLQAALIGGIGITSKWLGACHALAHPLSSLAKMHHGLACGIMLPYQMAYSLPGALTRYADIAQALDALPNASTRKMAQTAVTAVHDLITDINMPARLRDVNVSREMIPHLAKAAYTDLNWWTNPRTVNEEILADLYQQAY